MAQCRGVAIRDANGRSKVLPISNPSLLARNRIERILATVIALLLAAAGIFMREYLLLLGIPMMVGLFAISTGERLKPAAAAHARHAISHDQCPWCSAPLPAALESGKRPCQSCPAVWWDVAGLEAGTSTRQHKSRRFMANAGAACIGLLLGTLMAGAALSMNLVVIGIVLLITLLITPKSAQTYASRFANPIVCALALAAPSIIFSSISLMSANFTRGAVLAILGVGAGALAFSAGQRGVRQRPRDIILGRGRECAACAYDLRATAEGLPCPECGSLERVR